jgi:hypothetical protein
MLPTTRCLSLPPSKSVYSGRQSVRISTELLAIPTQVIFFFQFSSTSPGYCRELRGSFEKFVYSPYYSELELCGSAVMVSFRSTFLGKRCTSYNAPPTSRKRVVVRWSLRNSLPRSSLFMIGKTQTSHGARSGLNGGCSNGVPPIHFS